VDKFEICLCFARLKAKMFSASGGSACEPRWGKAPYPQL